MRLLLHSSIGDSGSPMFVSSTATLASAEFQSSEMAMNAVIQKHSSLPGTPVILTNNHNTQSFFIPRPSEGIHVAPLVRVVLLTMLL